MTVLLLTPDVANAAVRIEASQAPNGPVTLYRTDESGAVSIVRGSPFTAAGGAFAVVDQEAPFGQLSYTTDPKGTDATPVRLDVTQPWVTHPFAGFLSFPARVVDDADWTYPARTYVYDVLDRAEPVVTWYRRSSRTGTLSLAYETAAQRRAIRDALASGAPMLVRFPPGCAAFLTGYVAVFDERVLPLLPGSERGVVELAYIACAAPPGGPAAVPGWSWADVPGTYPSWRDVVAAQRSWSTLVTYNPAPAPAPFPGPPPGSVFGG